MKWLNDVESDLKKMNVKGWKEKMRNREQWRLVVKEAKAHPALLRRGTRARRGGGECPDFTPTERVGRTNVS
jgi:hypothetical protein